MSAAGRIGVAALAAGALLAAAGAFAAYGAPAMTMLLDGFSLCG